MTKEWEALDSEEKEALIQKAKHHPPTASSPLEKCDRLTLQFGITHESCGQQPVNASAASSILLKTKQQPYQRRLTVADKPVALDIGWLESASYLVIENKKTIPANAPTQQKAEHEKSYLVVSINSLPVFRILPGSVFVAHLQSVDVCENVSIASNFGSVPCNVSAFPD